MGTVSRLNGKVYEQIEVWRNRPLEGRYTYGYLDGIYLKHNRGGEYENAAVLIAMAVNQRGEREVLGAVEGMEEDKESRLSFLRRLKERGLAGTQLFAADKCAELIEALGQSFRKPAISVAKCTFTGMCFR